MIIRNTEIKKNSSTSELKSKHTRIYAVIFILITLLSSLYLRFAWNKYQYIASSEAIMLAQSLEALLPHEHIAELSGSAENIEKHGYIMTKHNLERLVETTNPIRFAYLMGEREGRIVFLLDAEPPNSVFWVSLKDVTSKLL